MSVRLMPSWVEPTEKDIYDIYKKIEDHLNKFGKISLATCKGFVQRPQLVRDHIIGWYTPCKINVHLQKINARTYKWVIDMPQTVNINDPDEDTIAQSPLNTPKNGLVFKYEHDGITEALGDVVQADGDAITVNLYDGVRDRYPALFDWRKSNPEILKGMPPLAHDEMHEVVPTDMRAPVDRDEFQLLMRKAKLNAMYGANRKSTDVDVAQTIKEVKALKLAMRTGPQEMKKDAGKPRLALVPPSLITAVGEILTFGADKYEPNGWKRVSPDRYKDAMVRHLCAYLEDENSVDEESGLPHLWHMTCNAAFLIDFKEKEKNNEC